MNATTPSEPRRSEWLTGLVAATATIFISALIGLGMAMLAPGLGAHFGAKWLTGWTIGLMFTAPASWLAMVGVRHHRGSRDSRHHRTRHSRLA